jgi:hypothetical protein
MLLEDSGTISYLDCVNAEHSAARPKPKVFDIKCASIDNLPLKAVNVALDIARIPDPRTRKQVAEAIKEKASDRLARQTLYLVGCLFCFHWICLFQPS